MPTRAADGIASLIISRTLLNRLPGVLVTPVMFPPGLDKLVMNPDSTGF
jgi:hypothetical protein